MLGLIRPAVGGRASFRALGDEGARDMGERCRAFFNEEFCDDDNFPKLSLSRALEWLRRKKWTIEEASFLLAGFDPDESDGSGVLPRAISEMKEWLYKTISYKETRSPFVVFANFYGEVCRSSRRGGYVDIDSLSYPIKAFYSFSCSELFQNNQLGADVPCFGLFHDYETEAQACMKYSDESARAEPLDDDFAAALFKAGIKAPLGWEFHPEIVWRENCRGDIVESEELVAKEASNPISFQEYLSIWEGAPLDEVEESSCASEVEQSARYAASSDDIVVVNGVTVKQLRGLLDEKNEGKTFCPVLLAGVRTALEVADKRNTIGFDWSINAENSFAKRIAKKRCVELEIFTADSNAKGEEKEEPSNADTNAVARCSRLTRKQREH